MRAVLRIIGGVLILAALAATLVLILSLITLAFCFGAGR